MNNTENTKVKEWYTRNYKTDELGTELDEKVTFKDVFNALDRQKDIYTLLAVDDSVVRERVFGELAEIMEIDYEYIYQQWIKGN